MHDLKLKRRDDGVPVRPARLGAPRQCGGATVRCQWLCHPGQGVGRGTRCSGRPLGLRRASQLSRGEETDENQTDDERFAWT